MKTDLPVYIGRHAISSLCRYCQEHDRKQFFLVADQNTYPALGQAVENALKGLGLDVKTIVLTGQEVSADEYYVMQVLLQVDRVDRTYLAVGSGTLTDIVRFASHRTKADFISMPTAPSMDGYPSIGAPLVVGGVKQTFNAQPPRAIFADLDILSAAPRQMIAAGFGDMLAKYTSLADWKLGRLLWGEPYSDEIAQRASLAVESCARQAEEIGRASSDGILSLTQGLMESGFCMLDFGETRPASGAEHHMSHFWEMKLLQENRPALLHGAKTGAATVIVARRYEEIRQLTRGQAAEMLKGVPMPDREQEIKHIRAAYHPGAVDQIIVNHAAFLDITASQYSQLQESIVEHWPDIQEIAATVPAPHTIAKLLRAVDGVVQPQAFGLSDDEVRLAMQHSHYLRDRFTIIKLSRMLGMQ